METFEEKQAAFTAKVHAALRAWRKVSHAPESYLDDLWLVQAQRSHLKDAENPALLRLATNQVLEDAMAELAVQDADAADILRRRFLDDETLAAAAYQLNVSEHTVSRQQRKAIEHLAMLLDQRERLARDLRVQTLAARLPPASYTRLFGVAAVQERLKTLLLQADAPWVLAIVGMGGIGKTALADSVTRELLSITTYADVIWLRIEPQSMSGQLPAPEITWEVLLDQLAGQLWPDAQHESAMSRREVALRQMLKARPFLIIVDNLEHQPDLADLLARINELANPSKFLITARTRPTNSTGILTITLDELSPDDADSLMRYHAQEMGLPGVAEAAAADLASIYALTGGNPLALKLVVSLLDVLPLADVLANVRRAEMDLVEGMFKRIYWQAWRVLSPHAKQLLKVMPLVAASGGTPDYLRMLSGMSEGELWTAMHELRGRSLLEVRGTLEDKKYGVHRLTETFLQTEIINWPDAGTSL